MQRLFIGLELPRIILQQLLALREEIPGARWQSAQQLHLTLCFIGNADAELTEQINSYMNALETAAFSLSLQGLGYFGPVHKPRALWLGAKPAASLIGLQKEVEHRLSALGLAPDTRPYQPHVTLARFSRNSPELSPGTVKSFLARHEDYRSPVFEVACASLFRSNPGPAGSLYEVIERFDLSPAT
ncbi:RNA 2',3'-cyclic phosphodiesterase [Marinobacter salicampi]|uniref:RNA 2',3'-cyclic phosphodiesterase n=1 Tax=Marinobacter salicampi TaxID=435907 RepID=UPI00140BC6C6|nr:RNA 2',3'-cyclic phosphodiesterase [Marinobacter salicampi]